MRAGRTGCRALQAVDDWPTVDLATRWNYVQGMKLKPWQARRINDALFPFLNYLDRLKCRMERTGFLPDDPLFRLVVAAYNAVQALRVELHCQGCDGGVGRKE
jgi:hypothetical protein